MPTFQVSIPDEDARLIYELTRVSGGTVPGWIREAALKALAAVKEQRKGRRLGEEPGLDKANDGR